MKKSFYFLVFFLFLFSLQAREIGVFDSKMEQNFNSLDDKSKELYKSIAQSNDNNDYQANYDNFIPNISLVLNAKEINQDVYINEAFPVELELITNAKINFDINMSFEKSDDMLWINQNPIWQQKNNSYFTTLWFEAKSSNAYLNKIIISLSRNDHIFQSSSLIMKNIDFKKIDAPLNKYSHIVASNLEVKQVRTRSFDNENLIFLMELNAQNTNLSGFYIKGVKKQGVEEIKGDFSNQSAFYYAILDKNTDKFEFSYFNKDKKELKNFSLKVELKEDILSTQSDLNPKTNNFNFYKQIFLWSICFVFALWFMFKKSYIALGLAILTLIASFLAQNNIYKAILKAESRVQILPTSNSTHFYSGKYQQEVEVLGSRENYKKILFNNGKIGWVMKDDLQKN